MTLVLLICSSIILGSLVRWHVPARRLLELARRHPVDAALIIAASCYLLAWGGSKAPVVTEKGITLESVTSSANGVFLTWSVEDDRIAPGATFMVQRRYGVGPWETLATTSNHTCNIEGFTLDRNYTYRIAVDITEAAE